MNTRGFVGMTMIFVALAVLVLICGGIYFLAQKGEKQPSVAQDSSEPTSFAMEEQAPPASDTVYPYLIQRGGTLVFTSEASFTLEAAREDCIRRVSLYTDNGSSSCYWDPPGMFEEGTLLYQVASKGADLALRNASILFPSRGRSDLQRVRFEVTNVGGVNNGISKPEFDFEVTLEYSDASSFTPLGNPVSGVRVVPLPGEVVAVEIDVPASVANPISGQLYPHYKAVIQVNGSRSIDEQNAGGLNEIKTPAWTISE